MAYGGNTHVCKNIQNEIVIYLEICLCSRYVKLRSWDSEKGKGVDIGIYAAMLNRNYFKSEVAVYC